MTDPNDIPSSGTRSLDGATSDTQNVSSEILEMIPIKGKTSEPGPRVSQCGEDKNPDKFYQMRHPWSFTPKTGEQLGEVMKHLKKELSSRGWTIKEYQRDTSPNRNLNLTADNDKKKFSVNITHYAKDNPPKLIVTVVSGCYQVPEGQRVDRY